MNLTNGSIVPLGDWWRPTPPNTYNSYIYTARADTTVTGVWVATDGMGKTRIFLEEIEALRWAIKSTEGSVQFVKFGEDTRAVPA